MAFNPEKLEAANDNREVQKIEFPEGLSLEQRLEILVGVATYVMPEYRKFAAENASQYRKRGAAGKRMAKFVLDIGTQLGIDIPAVENALATLRSGNESEEAMNNAEEDAQKLEKLLNTALALLPKLDV